MPVMFARANCSWWEPIATAVWILERVCHLSMVCVPIWKKYCSHGTSLVYHYYQNLIVFCGIWKNMANVNHPHFSQKYAFWKGCFEAETVLSRLRQGNIYHCAPCRRTMCQHINGEVAPRIVPLINIISGLRQSNIGTAWWWRRTRLFCISH